MRILVLMNLAAPVTGGVINKIYAKCNYLKQRGHEVFFLPPNGLIYDQKKRFAPFLLDNSDDYFRICGEKKKGILSKIIRVLTLLRLIRKSGISIIYYRYTPSPATIFVLAFCGIPFVQEHNTFELKEMSLLKNRKGMLIDRSFGLLSRYLSKGLVAVTPEILDYQSKKLLKNKKGIVISNSIDLKDIPFKEHHLPGNKNLVFLGGLDPWEGIDRLIRLMRELDDFQLVIIGDGRERKKLEHLSKEYGVAERVEFSGVLKGVTLQKKMEKCDLGISALGLHRKNIMSASPLKTRHYLAIGLPVVMGYKDVDLGSDLPFVLRVPADESPLNPEVIRAFYERIVADESICSQTREYAEQNLATEIKMRQLESFLKQTVS